MYISTVGARPDRNNELIDSHFATDQALINSGLAWTILRMSVYGHATRRRETRRSLWLLRGCSRSACGYAVRDDIAAAAAGILATPGHEGMNHATGPVSIGQPEIAETIAKAAGKQISFKEMTAAEHRASLEATAIPAPLVQIFAGFQAALRAGIFDLVTGDVGRLSGKQAESPLEFLARNLASTVSGARG
jgi:NAD(P)H dehydrogenase (quinone)